jgi:rhomboid family GlyGly-CTERM serine protease
MELLKRSEQGLISRLKAATYWHFAASLIIISFLVDVFGDQGRDWFKYDRLAIEAGEYWRFVTAHIVHLGKSHLNLNMLGFILTWLLVGRNYSVPEWIFVTFISVLLQSLGFWFLDTNMLWYVGMSGLLHGYIIAGAAKGFKTLRTESGVLCGLVILKLIYEQIFGPLPGSESMSGGNVVINAHLYGALGGALAALVLWRRGKVRGSI